MNLDDSLHEDQISTGDHTEVAERSQAIKFVLRQGKNWDKMSIPNKEALEHIAGLIGIILSGDMDDPINWNSIAGAARLRGIALDVPKTFKVPDMDASIEDGIRAVVGKFSPRAT